MYDRVIDRLTVGEMGTQSYSNELFQNASSGSRDIKQHQFIHYHMTFYL